MLRDSAGGSGSTRGRQYITSFEVSDKVRRFPRGSVRAVGVGSTWLPWARNVWLNVARGTCFLCVVECSLMVYLRIDQEGLRMGFEPPCPPCFYRRDGFIRFSLFQLDSVWSTAFLCVTTSFCCRAVKPGMVLDDVGSEAQVIILVNLPTMILHKLLMIRCDTLVGHFETWGMHSNDPPPRNCDVDTLPM